VTGGLRKRRTEGASCADKGYAWQPGQESLLERKYIPHVKQRGEEVAARERILDIVRVDGWLNGRIPG